MREAALADSCCAKAKHGQGGLAVPTGAVGRACAPSPGITASSEHGGCLSPMCCPRHELHLTQHHVCVCPRGKQQPKARHTAPQEPRRVSSPLAFPAGSLTQTPCPKRGSCLSALLPARGGTACTHGCQQRCPLGPSLPAHPAPETEPFSPGSSPLHLWDGLAGQGLPPAGGPARRGRVWQVSSSSRVAMPPCAPMASPGLAQRLGLRARLSLHQRLLPGEAAATTIFNKRE